MSPHGAGYDAIPALDKHDNARFDRVIRKMGIISFIDPHFLAVCSIARTLSGSFIGGLIAAAGFTIHALQCGRDALSPAGVADDADRHGGLAMARVPNARDVRILLCKLR